MMKKLSKELNSEKFHKFMTFFNIASAEKQALARKRAAQQKANAQKAQNELFLSIANAGGVVYDNNPASNSVNAGGWHFQ